MNLQYINDTLSLSVFQGEESFAENENEAQQYEPFLFTYYLTYLSRSEFTKLDQSISI